MRLQDWWAAGRFIQLDSDWIFAMMRGEGPTIVFLHGFPTSSHDWADVIADLSRDFRCVAFDYLGYGASDKPQSADYSSISQTNRALKILQILDVSEATFVGHDLGGIVLQQLLHCTHQGGVDLRIEQAVFANSSVFSELYRPTPVQLALVDPAQGKTLARQVSRVAFEASIAAMFPAYPPAADLLDDMWAAISRDNGQHLWPEQLVYMAERNDHGGAWVESMKQTPAALGFVYGLADPISGAQILAHAEAELPRARCVGLPSLGHYPQVESPWAFIAALRTLLPQRADT
jgi:pimeloyl-ACP methyl ester carboxylesterase